MFSQSKDSKDSKDSKATPLRNVDMPNFLADFILIFDLLTNQKAQYEGVLYDILRGILQSCKGRHFDFSKLADKLEFTEIYNDVVNVFPGYRELLTKARLVQEQKSTPKHNENDGQFATPINKMHILMMRELLLKFKNEIKDEKKYSSVNDKKAREILSQLCDDKFAAFIDDDIKAKHSQIVLLLPVYKKAAIDIIKADVIKILSTEPTKEHAHSYGDIAFKVRATPAIKEINAKYLKFSAENSVEVAKNIISSRLCNLLSPSSLLDIYYAHRHDHGFKLFASNNYKNGIQEKALLSYMVKNQLIDVDKVNNSANLSAIMRAQMNVNAPQKNYIPNDVNTPRPSASASGSGAAKPSASASGSGAARPSASASGSGAARPSASASGNGARPDAKSSGSVLPKIGNKILASDVKSFKDRKLNPYELLGVRADSDEKEIAKAYRKKVLVVHPDQHLNSVAINQEGYKQQSSDLDIARNILLDPVARLYFTPLQAPSHNPPGGPSV